MPIVPTRRLTRWVAPAVFGVGWLLGGTVAAVDVAFEPPEGRPGTIVEVDYECAVTPDGAHVGPPFDAMIFSRRPARLEPDTGYVDRGDPLLSEFPAAGLTFVGPHSTFVVPRVPGGIYYLYATCAEHDLLDPLEPTFRVIGVPATSTDAARPEPRNVSWVLPGLAFGLALAVAYRSAGRRHGMHR